MHGYSYDPRRRCKIERIKGTIFFFIKNNSSLFFFHYIPPIYIDYEIEIEIEINKNSS